MTRLEFFNKVFQITGFRVCRVGELVYNKGSDTTSFIQKGWGLLGPVLPFTGWRTPYKGWAKTLFTVKVKEREINYD